MFSKNIRKVSARAVGWKNMNEDESFEKLTKEFLDRFLDNNPDFATQLGLHDPYD
jgi:hypothetical protein